MLHAFWKGIGRMNFSFAYSLKKNEVTLTNCDREPVHVPGCIQPFGALLAVNPETGIVTQASANAPEWFNISPEAMTKKPVSEIVGEENGELLAKMVADNKIETYPRYVFSFNGSDILAHLHDGVLILEAEKISSLTEDEERRAYHTVSHISARLRNVKGLQPFCQTLAGEVRGLTGLDRVMIYKFHEDYSGEVIAEAKREDLHSYLNMRYPSEDIPQPAREIFRKIWVRPVPAVDYEPVEVTPLINPATNRPLDMTYCFLRGASVMYTDYLKNMGVAMALTLSIVVEGKLWGLIACHHNSPRQVPWPTRAACELLAQMASLQLKTAENAEYAVYRERMEKASQQMIDEMIESRQGLEALFSASSGLLDFIDADGVAILDNGAWHTRGSTPGKTELRALAQWLRQEFTLTTSGVEVLHTHALSERFAPARNFTELASGMLAIQISRNNEDLVIWFRRELEQTIHWAGDPYSKVVTQGPGGERLLPRTSFDLWKESVHGQSAPWKTVEIEAARRLRLAIMEIMAARLDAVTRENRELAVSNAELDAFAYITSHDLREPLRGIYHYAHFLKESAESRADSDSMEQSESLIRLIRRMDGLIESLLQFSRVGRLQLEKEKVDVGELVQEAADIIYISRTDKKPNITILPGLPAAYGDRPRLRELFTNLMSNAVKYNDGPNPSIEIGFKDGAYFVRDDGIGIPSEYEKVIFQMFKRLHAKDEYGGGTGAGLPIVQKIVERHGGELWLESEPGKGTVFYFTLPEA